MRPYRRRKPAAPVLDKRSSIRQNLGRKRGGWNVTFLYTPWTPVLFVAFLLSLGAQLLVQSRFARYGQIPASRGLTGRSVAEAILRQNGLYDVAVEPVPGSLSDHYDPTERVVRLSEGVYDTASIAAVAVAAHEVGHAIQHGTNYPLLVLRHRLVPVLNITSGLAPWLILAGILFKASELFLLGVLFFAGVVLFHLVTLPVEFDASRRALRELERLGFVSPAELPGARKVLTAAALTYVAAATIAALQLFEYIWIFSQGQDEA
ncbi:MAG: zinc metallopeptidase [Brockia lithotrophica]|nr:zinc metallopeptidase [Brockia lithotrophica]